MSETDIKRCSRCKGMKSFSDFGPDKRHKDGLQSHCRECDVKSSTRYAQTKIGKLNHQRANSRYAQTQKGKERHRCNESKYEEKWPEKAKAHGVVLRAINSGKLTRSNTCELCKEKKSTEAHHPDYNKPLDVDWICPGCHRLLHKELLLV